jgi:tRNA modification GTPase
MKNGETIAAVSTPVGEGGIGIVRLSGPDALSIADRIFVSRDGGRPSEFATYTVHYGIVADGARKRPVKRSRPKAIDEVLLTVMRSPKSYTREDIVEINCHGGAQAVRRVLDTVLKSGARMAEPGEFTRRAFLNGRIDLSQAEAVLDVIRAKTEGAMKVAMHQLEGGLSARVEGIRSAVIDIASHIEASIDFPDEGLEPAVEKELSKLAGAAVDSIRELIGTYASGAVLREGVLAIICGKPNAGKSSLMNLLLKRDRVIVSPIPGTTRDAVEETINLRGIPIRLVDTAGIARTDDILGREGIKKSRRYLELADLVILVLDGSRAFDDDDRSLIKLIREKKTVAVVNKCDLPKRFNVKLAPGLPKGVKPIRISVKTGSNIGKLEDAIAEAVWSGGIVQGESAVVSNARHKELLDKALDDMLSVKRSIKEGLSPELISVYLNDAIRDLGLITGKSVSDDILDRIFERFCVGK